MPDDDVIAAAHLRRPDALYLQNTNGRMIQAVTPKAYSALAKGVDLDDQGGYMWTKLADTEDDEIERERIFALIESEGLEIRFQC